MLAYLTRHGQTEYRQGKVSLDEALDLTPEGRDRVIMSALDGASHMRLNGINAARIKSSPYGRTLYSANIWDRALKGRGIETKIEICSELQEVKNLIDFTQYLALVNGGNINLDGKNHFIDVTMTNPEGHKPFLYFRNDNIHGLSPKARESLPYELVQRIDAIETCVDAIERYQRFLDGLEKIPQNEAHVLVTHSGPVSHFTEMVAKKDSGTPYLDCGKFFVLESHDNIWVPVYVQEGAIQYEK